MLAKNQNKILILHRNNYNDKTDLLIDRLRKA